MLTIEKDRAITPGTGDSGARQHFNEYHWVALPRLLGLDLLTRVRHGVDRAVFLPSSERTGRADVRRLLMEPNSTTALLWLCFNDSRLLATVRSITGCDDLAFFQGTVYRLTPDEADIPWHDDCVGQRRIAMTVNLGGEPYEGGALQLRERDSARIQDLPNPGPGDGILFRIDPSLQHRNTTLTRGMKTAFAGWFSGGSSFAERLRSAAAAGEQ